MPNRVVRSEILDSDKVNKLSWAAEVFYRRLMSIVDDYGLGDGRIPVIRSKLYPLRLDRVSESDIIKWIAECESSGLVSLYQVNGNPYLEIVNFGQTVRQKKAKYPFPPREQMQADASRCEQMRLETKRNETETNPAARIIPHDPTDYYSSGQTAFEDIKNNEQLMEDLTRIFHNNGYKACNGVHVMLAVKKFLTIESPKDEFKIKPKGQVKSHLINWMNKNINTLANG
jgi:hypothetical protein